MRIEVISDEVSMIFLDGIEREFVDDVAGTYAPGEIFLAYFECGPPCCKAEFAAASAVVLFVSVLADIFNSGLEPVGRENLCFV